MVSTRSSRRRAREEEEPLDDDDYDKSEPHQASTSKNDNDDAVDTCTEPKPISSSSEESSLDEEEEEEVVSDTAAAASKEREQHVSPWLGQSRLFAPYTCLGVISNGTGYSLTHTGDSSATSFCTLPVGNRFCVRQCDKLFPVLTSRACRHEVEFVESDASLQITAVGHGKRYLTLYRRTRPVDTFTLSSKQNYATTHVLHLGRIQVPMQGEKEGKQENVAVIGVVLKKLVEEDDEGVPVVGQDDDEDSDSDGSSDEDSSQDDSFVNDGNNNSSGQVVIVLASRTHLQFQNRIALPVDFGTPTVALHPSTYLNKLVVGSSSKGLLLLNVRTSKIVHRFQSISDQNVTALEQSPAVDTVAVGTQCGHVHLLNFKHDKVLFTLQHEHAAITSLSFRTDGSAVRYGVCPLAVGRSDGTISIWDLNEREDGGGERTLLTQLFHVHPGGVRKLSYFPHEPLLLSTGTQSNCVQMHVFDAPDHSARLLRQRSGHTAPPTLVKYKYSGTSLLHQSLQDGSDASAFQVLSGGGSKDGTLREFSSVRSVLDKEYSQGRGLTKRAKQLQIPKSDLLLPPILDMARCEAKTRDWGDLVTIHKHHSMAYVWSTRRGAQSGPVLRQPQWNVSAVQVPPPQRTHAASVCLSACGNYCLVGTQGGIIYKYNVQSGIPRGTFPIRDEDDSAETKPKRRHAAGDVNRTVQALAKRAQLSNRSSDGTTSERDKAIRAKTAAVQKRKLLVASHTGHAVTGLAVDSLNKTLISVGKDAKLILWNFRTRAPHKRSPYKLPSGATKMVHVRDSNMAAIGLEDYTVIVFDCSALSIVRRLGHEPSAGAAHAGPISGLDWSPDGRTLFSASLDGTVRVWDVPTSTCVDWMSFSSPPTSLSVGPTGEFFATTHANRLGICLWSDKSLYRSINANGATTLLAAEPARMDDPVPAAAHTNEDDRREPIANQRDAIAEGRTKRAAPRDIAPPPAKQSGLITTSGLPPAHWKNLFRLELVKERNKPKEAPKKPPSAPFFLQWRGGDALGNSSTREDRADEWAAAWSDDEEHTKKEADGDDNDDDNDDDEPSIEDRPNKKRGRVSVAENANEALAAASTTAGFLAELPKKRKVGHARSHLAALLVECQSRASSAEDGTRFQAVTEHVATLGPSAIDVAFSTLCHGMHDLEEGLPLLHVTSMWLLEACQSRQRYEAVNAYLHRFLYLHSNVIAGIDDCSVTKQTQDENEQTEGEREEKEQERRQRVHLLETIAQLRVAQRAASDALCAKMQHSLCLLRHFSRMV